MMLWTEAVIVAVIGFVSVMIGNVIAGWFQLRKVRSSSDLDESQVAEKYQALAAAQAEANRKQEEMFNKKFNEQAALIDGLRKAITGPWDIRIIALTGLKPEVLEASIRLSPQLGPEAADEKDGDGQ